MHRTWSALEHHHCPQYGRRIIAVFISTWDPSSVYASPNGYGSLEPVALYLISLVLSPFVNHALSSWLAIRELALLWAGVTDAKSMSYYSSGSGIPPLHPNTSTSAYKNPPFRVITSRSANSFDVGWLICPSNVWLVKDMLRGNHQYESLVTLYGTAQWHNPIGQSRIGSLYELDNGIEPR